MNTRSFLLSSLLAGALIGTLANLPILNLINCFLCIWVWLGGALSVVFYRRFQGTGPAPTPGQGAGLGAVSGLIGTLVGFVVYSLTSFISMPIFASVGRFFQVEDIPFETSLPSLASVLASAFFFFLLNVVAYPLFGAISGLIAASLRKDQPAA